MNTYSSLRACRKQAKQSPRLLRPRLCYRLAMTVLLLTRAFVSGIFASEVIEETNTVVVVRQHPRTSKLYVSLTRPDRASHDPFESMRRFYSRPDYRMLDPKIKSGKIPYDGPYSDRTKIYLFAASLATLGTVSGAVAMAAAPAATGAAASGGAGAYLAGGTAVVAGSVAAAEVAMKPDTKKGNYTLRAESHQLKVKEKEQEEEGNAD